MSRSVVFVGALSTLMLASPTFAQKGLGNGPCNQASQCKGGVCVEINQESYCSKVCGACPSGMYCDAQMFALTGLKVCLRGASEKPVQPKAPPRLPCQTDAECTGDLICAEMMGQRDCTLPCTQASQCEMPEVMGVKIDFLSCQPDQGTKGRKACLPKRACMANPAQCMSFDPTAMTQTMTGLMKMTETMEKQTEQMMPADPATDPAMPAPSAKPASKKRRAMGNKRFTRLLSQVDDAGFADERETVLKTAARRNHFTCRQLAQIIEKIDFGDERVAAVRIIAPRLVDLENSHEVLAKFNFDDEKAAAAKILNAQK